MLEIKIVYDNEQDKELLDLIDIAVPFFVDYINVNTSKGRKEGFKLMNYWSARKLPLVVIKTDKLDAMPIVKYSDIGENAINQLIKYLNDFN